MHHCTACSKLDYKHSGADLIYRHKIYVCIGHLLTANICALGLECIHWQQG